MSDPRKPIFEAVRDARGKGFKTAEVKALDAALDALGVPRASAAAPASGRSDDPAWLAEARRHMGKSEIPGSRHSAFVLGLWKALGRPYTDDEVPWCGGFVGYCLKQVGEPMPSVPERAKAWASWGKPCGIVLGAIAVFGREGGGHVGFVVGESDTHLYILGGNQRNQVNIMPIAKGRLLATRWPAGRTLGSGSPPPMSGGIVSVNEA